MSRARDLFTRLQQAGVAAIDEFIRERRSEELFLDFKRVAHDGAGDRLDTDARKNLSKAISGFGNSEGGVIVWGVDCRPNSQRGDVAQAKHPLVDAARFKSQLEGAVSGCTIPPHPLVEHCVIPASIAADDRSGFVATLIEAASNPPLRDTEDQHYHVRAGSSFQIVSHGVLGGLFGRPPAPRLSHHWEIRVVERQSMNCMVVKTTLHVRNIGIAIAREIFASVDLVTKLGDRSQCLVRAIQSEEWERSSIHRRLHSNMSRDSVRLAPGAVIDAFEVELWLPEPPAADLVLDCTVGCSNGPPEHFRVHRDAASLARIRDEFFAEMPTAEKYEAKPARKFGKQIFSGK